METVHHCRHQALAPHMPIVIPKVSVNQYQLHPFHLHARDNSPMLVTAQSVVRVVNEAFCRLMQGLSESKLSLITEEMLAIRTQEHGLPHEATRDFLVARGVLRLLGNA